MRTSYVKWSVIAVITAGAGIGVLSYLNERQTDTISKRDLRLEPDKRTKEQEAKEIERKIRRNNAELVAKGYIVDAPEANFNLIGDDGSITDYAIETVGLKASDKKFILDVVGDSRKKLADCVKKSTSLNKEQSDPGNGIYVYSIKNFKDEAEEIFRTAENQFDQAFGSSAAKLLISAMQPRQSFQSAGKYSATVKFYEAPSILPGDPPYPAAETNLFDPKTGNKMGSRAFVNPDELQRYFGDAFTLTKPFFEGDISADEP